MSALGRKQTFRFRLRAALANSLHGSGIRLRNSTTWND